MGESDATSSGEMAVVYASIPETDADELPSDFNEGNTVGRMIGVANSAISGLVHNEYGEHPPSDVVTVKKFTLEIEDGTEYLRTYGEVPIGYTDGDRVVGLE